MPLPSHTTRGARRPAFLPRAAALLALLPGACRWTDAPVHPRPPLPLPDGLAARYALPGPVVRDDDNKPDERRILHGTLRCGREQVEFHLHLCDAAPRGIVLLVPILAGGEHLMRNLAGRLVAHGYHAVWCKRIASALTPPQRGPDLELLFRRTVLHQRAVLEWLLAEPDFAALPPFALGISMGGMVTTVLLAVEPRLRGGAVCLAGADLPAIVLESGERRVGSWRQWRLTHDCIGRASLLQELDRYLRSDPLHLAPFVATERVLFVSAMFDDVVRPMRQDLLWEALGRPQRLSVPFGHYSAALVLNAILDAIVAFFAAAQA